MPSTKVKLKVKKRSAFSKDHVHQLTSSVGTITPIMIDELIPNSTVNLRLNIGASLPPLAADTFMKCDIAVEAFFIPLRLCSASFEPWFCEREDPYYHDEGVEQHKYYLPVAQLDLSELDFSEHFGVRSLADYLGWSSSYLSGSLVEINPLPFIAYHLCWQYFYRQNLVEKECFARIAPDLAGVNPPIQVTGELGSYGASVLPYYSFVSSNGCILSGENSNCWLLADGVSLWDTRQRNFDFDYFVNAFPTPSLGDDVSVETDGDGAFTINQLRMANSIQEFRDKNQIAGTRYNDTLKARYGASLHDAVAQRPICLGSARYNVYNRSSVVAANNLQDIQKNPFANYAGGVQGNAYASGSDFIIDHFTANEPGYILVNATLVPTVTYSTAIDKLFVRYRDPEGSLMDMANPMFQGVGNEPIYKYELNGDIGLHSSSKPIFGYTDRYASWKTKHDRISGLFRSGMNLSSFVSQRWFNPNSSPSINSSFLKIPSDYLDDVLITATDGRGTRYGYWMECAFDYKVVMPLAEYSVPSLIDPAAEHGETVTVHRGGFRF